MKEILSFSRATTLPRDPKSGDAAINLFLGKLPASAPSKNLLFKGVQGLGVGVRGLGFKLWVQGSGFGI